MNQEIKSQTKIFLGDSLGEMFAYYAVADLAVIGGSFLPLGGQNLIEAIYLHKPVLFGPSMFNFSEIAANALADKCAIQVSNPDECFVTIKRLFHDAAEYATLTSNCETFITRYQGASVAIVKQIEKYL